MVSEGGCPVTYRFMKEVEQLWWLEDDEVCRVTGLYDDLIDECRELLGQARALPTNAADQRLRAFYCLEVMSHLLLPRELMKSRMQDPEIDVVFSQVVPFTREGLSQLSAALDALKKRSMVTATEMDMSGVRVGTARADVQAVRRQSMSKLDWLVERAEKVTRHLRADLNKEAPSLEMVGSTFANTLHDLNEPLTQCLHHGRALLNISETTGSTTWSRTK